MMDSSTGDWQQHMRGLLGIILILTLPLIGSLALANDSGEPDARALLEAAVEHLQAAESFKLAITQTGEAYPLAISLDGVNTLPASLISADAQYIKPGELFLTANMRVFLSLWMHVYSLDESQWLSFPAGAPWIPLPAYEGFDVNRLMAADDGIELVVETLREARIIKAATDNESEDEDEDTAWTLSGLAEPAAVTGLLFGFVEPNEDVQLLARLSVEDGSFVALELTMLETVDQPGKAPTVWHIEFSDYDAERDFEPPSL